MIRARQWLLLATTATILAGCAGIQFASSIRVETDISALAPATAAVVNAHSRFACQGADLEVRSAEVIARQSGYRYRGKPSERHVYLAKAVSVCQWSW